MKVFLSYTHRDREAADLINQVLRDEGFEVVRLDDLPAGSDIGAAIIRAIDQSDAVVVLLSKWSSKSTWLDAEVAASSLSTQGVSPKPIIPVKLDKDAPIPALLQNRIWLDLSDVAQRVQAGPALSGALRAKAVPGVDTRSRASVIELERRVVDEEQRTYLSLYARTLTSLRTFLLIGLSLVLLLSAGAIALAASHPVDQVVIAALTVGTAAATFVVGWLTREVQYARRK